MIISRAPVRITLGGGGTDLASYYSKYGGVLIAGAIDKYIYLAVNKRFHQSIRLSYSETEIVNQVKQIKHKIFREAFKFLGIKNGIEAVSIADIPSNSGLGSSSSFTVSLLNALHTYKKEYVSLHQLAEEACKLEIEILGEPIGKQDQYMASFGGVTCLTFKKNGQVIVESIRMSDENLSRLENNILLFYTGIERKASDILKTQNKKSQKNDAKIIETLHLIKKIGLETRKALESGKIDRFGELLDLHWQTKKKLSKKISDPFIDECYETALKNGAIGGKIMGAGGGGFFLFYQPENNKSKLVQALTKKGLKPMRFKFDFEGAKIVANLRRF